MTFGSPLYVVFMSIYPYLLFETQLRICVVNVTVWRQDFKKFLCTKLFLVKFRTFSFQVFTFFSRFSGFNFISPYQRNTIQTSLFKLFDKLIRLELVEDSHTWSSSTNQSFKSEINVNLSTNESLEAMLNVVTKTDRWTNKLQSNVGHNNKSKSVSLYSCVYLSMSLNLICFKNYDRWGKDFSFCLKKLFQMVGPRRVIAKLVVLQAGILY